jgi:hypothetical protein
VASAAAEASAAEGSRNHPLPQLQFQLPQLHSQLPLPGLQFHQPQSQPQLQSEPPQLQSQPPAPTQSSGQIQQPPANRYLCSYQGCGRNYKHYTSLFNHVREYHKASALCPKCDITFDSKFALDQHNTAVHFTFRCLLDGCNAAYASQKGLTFHRWHDHPEMKGTYFCSVSNCVYSRTGEMALRTGGMALRGLNRWYAHMKQCHDLEVGHPRAGVDYDPDNGDRTGQGPSTS